MYDLIVVKISPFVKASKTWQLQITRADEQTMSHISLCNEATTLCRHSILSFKVTICNSLCCMLNGRSTSSRITIRSELYNLFWGHQSIPLLALHCTTLTEYATYLLSDQRRNTRWSFRIWNRCVVWSALLNVHTNGFKSCCSSNLLIGRLGRLFLIHFTMPIRQVRQSNTCIALDFSL